VFFEAPKITSMDLSVYIINISKVFPAISNVKTALLFNVSETVYDIIIRNWCHAFIMVTIPSKRG
jgi:hypothetical protein